MLDAKYLEACKHLDKAGRGSVKGGTVITGSLLDWCSVTDDPEGRGYIALMTADGHATDTSTQTSSQNCSSPSRAERPDDRLLPSIPRAPTVTRLSLIPLMSLRRIWGRSKWFRITKT